MKLSELIYAFDMDYLLECSKRNSKRIDFTQGHKALMLSKTISDIQKSFGVVDIAIQINSVVNVNLYGISNAFMTPNCVLYNGSSLEQTTGKWINQATPEASQPCKYAIEYFDNAASLILYPTPIQSNDVIALSAKFDFALYSPSIINNDFGSFNGTTFSGETCFPTQYDRLILYGMLKQIFPEIEADYYREKILLMGKQVCGASLTDYNMTGVVNEGRTYKIRTQ